MKPSEYFGEGAWNLPGRLDPLSTLMWRVEQDPMLRSGLVLVMLLDRAPDPRRFAAGHEWATRMVPRLRERPMAPLLTPTMPVWTQDPEFDCRRHMRRVALPRPAGRAELLGLAEDLAATPFDLDARPPWESVLVEELRWEPEGYRAAWLVRFHHCLADGNLVAFWLATLLGRSREPRNGKAWPAIPPRWLASVPEQLIGPLTDNAAGRPRLARSAFAAARAPVSTALEVAKATRKLLEVTTRSAGRPSPLLRPRGTTRRLASVTIDLDKLRAAARDESVSVNAAYTAALLAGLRRYHEAHNVRVPSVSAAITIPRAPIGPRLLAGNQFNGGKFAGPLDEPDPRALCRMVERSLAQAAPPFTPAVLDAVLSGVTKLPTPALLHLARSLGRSHDIQISHVVAPSRDTYVSGARVEQILTFGPAPGCAVMALLVSRRSQGTLALTLDTAAIPDQDTFVRCVEDGFADVSSPTR